MTTKKAKSMDVKERILMLGERAKELWQERGDTEDWSVAIFEVKDCTHEGHQTYWAAIRRGGLAGSEEPPRYTDIHTGNLWQIESHMRTWVKIMETKDDASKIPIKRNN